VRIRSLILAAVILFLHCDFLYEEGEVWRVTYTNRMQLIARAAVWHPSVIYEIQVAKGPAGGIAVPPETEVTCRYVEPKGKTKGYSPKFRCTLVPSGKLVRVKFGSGEARAEAAGTRLLWALGFYTDHVYPVKLKCLGCPEKNPAHPSAKEKRVERLFTDTIMEENFTGLGKEIGEFPDQGWRWDEADFTDPSRGGATRAQVDALKLIAVFMQHTDSKAEQQRLACYLPFVDHSGGILKCKKSVLMIQDLGQTFGKGSSEITNASSMDLASWKSVDIWKQSGGQCIGNLIAASFTKEEGLTNPHISEEGRRFLADLLNQLSDMQIREFFQVARVENIDDWVAAFKSKRKQINDRKCE